MLKLIFQTGMCGEYETKLCLKSVIVADEFFHPREGQIISDIPRTALDTAIHPETLRKIVDKIDLANPEAEICWDRECANFDPIFIELDDIMSTKELMEVLNERRDHYNEVTYVVEVPRDYLSIPGGNEDDL